MTHHNMPRTRRHSIAVGLTATVLAATTACGGSDTPSTNPLTPSTSSTTSITTSPSPSSSTNSEQAKAFAGAEKGWRNYTQGLDILRRDGGQNPQRIEKLATGEALQFAQKFVSQLYIQRQWRGKGAVSIVYVKPRVFTPGAKTKDGNSTVGLTACHDSSGATIIDKNGQVVKRQVRSTDFYEYSVIMASYDGGSSWIARSFDNKSVKSCAD